MTNPTQIGAVLRIPINLVHPGPNARGDTGDVTDLATSIRTIGQQEPAIVEANTDGTYTIFEGHRRRAAIIQAGLPHIDAVVRAAGDPATRITRQLAMHALAAAFDPIAEAKALHTLVFEEKRSTDEIARAIGRSPRWVSGRLALLMLNDLERAEVQAGRMPVAHALAVVNQRRAERDGRPIPTPAPKHTPYVTAAPRLAAPSRAPVVSAPWFTVDHPLADAARLLCDDDSVHAVRTRIGPACGECWEQVIRDHERSQP